MLLANGAAFEPDLPARIARRSVIIGFVSADPGHQVPAQMGGTGLPLGAIAQKEHRAARLGGTQAQPATGREVERLVRPADIGNHGCHGPAGKGFLGRPEQFAHIGRPDQHQRGRVEPEAHEPRTIGQTQILRFPRQLQIKHGHAPWR